MVFGLTPTQHSWTSSAVAEKSKASLKNLPQKALKQCQVIHFAPNRGVHNSFFVVQAPQLNLWVPALHQQMGLILQYCPRTKQYREENISAEPGFEPGAASATMCSGPMGELATNRDTAKGLLHCCTQFGKLALCNKSHSNVTFVIDLKYLCLLRFLQRLFELLLIPYVLVSCEHSIGVCLVGVCRKTGDNIIRYPTAAAL